MEVHQACQVESPVLAAESDTLKRSSCVWGVGAQQVRLRLHLKRPHVAHGVAWKAALVLVHLAPVP